MADTINNIAAKISGQENKEVEINRFHYTGDNKELKRFCGPYLGFAWGGAVPIIFSELGYEGREQHVSDGDWVIKISDTEFRVVDSKVYDILTKQGDCNG